MMNRLGLLAGIFAVQLVLIGALALIGEGDQTESSFLDLAMEDISAMSIEDAEDGRIELISEEGGWRFPDGVPADAGKVEQLLEKLTVVGTLWPVASSAASQDRFEVTEDNHQRRIGLEANTEDSVEIYLGTSPGYRRVHARESGSDDVYSIDFAHHEAPADADEWLKKNLLKTQGLTGVSLQDGWKLSQQDDGWLLDGGEADAAEARAMIDRVADLRVLGFFSGNEAALGESRELLIEHEGGDTRLVFRHDAEEDEYAVTSDRIGGGFIVASYVAEQILVPADNLGPQVETQETDLLETEPAVRLESDI